MQIFAPLTSEQNPGIQRVEIASSFQLPSLHIVGLPSPEVAEARERIRAALESSGFDLPKRRIVVNLSPASIRKRGTGLDLAMALAVLSLQRPCDPVAENSLIAAWGELGLDGSVKPSGQPTRVLFATWQTELQYLFVAREEVPGLLRARRWMTRAGLFSYPGPVIIPVVSLQDAWFRLQSLQDQKMYVLPQFKDPPEVSLESASERLLPLTPSLERLIGIAAVGRLHLILLGAKGAGKSHALEWLIQLQPECSDQMKIHRALLAELGQSTNQELVQISNVRRVSPGVRPGALTGSASSHWIKPGEFSLAHGGLLIADEFPEWARDSREALREPLERGLVTLTRTRGGFEFPARFSLAANGNLCSCGGWPPEHPIPIEIQQTSRKLPRCHCSQKTRNDYRARLSGPILDRMDLVLFVGSNMPKKTSRVDLQQAFDQLRSKVTHCRRSLEERWGEAPGLLSGAETEQILRDHPHWEESLERVANTSLRARHKIVRVAMSLAAWDEEAEPNSGHFMEAAFYRPERFGLCD